MTTNELFLRADSGAGTANKIALSADDDKRKICDNKIETFAHGFLGNKL